MKKNMMMTLKQAISNVLETMFFLSVHITEGDGLLEQWFAEDQRLRIAKIRFSGPHSGSFFLFVPLNMTTKFTADFLGLDEDKVENTQEEDTVREALNMISGYVLSHTDKAAEFQLSIPEVITNTEAALAAYHTIQENMFFVETEIGRLSAGLHLD
jgi:chemotaxis protein CheY-P-specific phosphatase CheC